MTPWPFELVIIAVGFVVGMALIIVSVVKTVRFHGWGQRTWAPPAVPWFVAGMVVGLVTLGYGLYWGLS